MGFPGTFHRVGKQITKTLPLPQLDGKGRNYLHAGIMNNDIDGVLFLLSVEVDVNSRMQDGSHRTPLMLAVPGGSEVIIRHLVNSSG